MYKITPATELDRSLLKRRARHEDVLAPLKLETMPFYQLKISEGFFIEAKLTLEESNYLRLHVSKVAKKLGFKLSMRKRTGGYWIVRNS